MIYKIFQNHKKTRQFIFLVILGVGLLQIFRYTLQTFSFFNYVKTTDPMGLERIFRFSFLNTNSHFSIVLTVFFTLILISFLHLHKNLHKQQFYSIILISIGIYSNLAEKIIYRNVLDYLNFGFAIFNFADIFIILGLVWLNFPTKKQK